MMFKYLLFISAILATLCLVEAEAGPACIFNGADVKCLKDNIKFKTTSTRIMTGDSDDPTSVAKSADESSLYLRDGTAEVYIKQDTGSTTNWTLVGGTTTVEFTITQANTFNQLDAIYHNGSSWVPAQADDGATLAEYVVTSTPHTASFTAAKFGRYAISNSLTVGEHYFLSATTAGGSSTVEGTTYSSPLFYVEDSSNIHIEVLRPSVTADLVSGTVKYAFTVGTTADVTNNAADFDTIAGALSSASDGNKIILLGDREFTENVTLTKNVTIEGYGSTSTISGTVDFNSGSDDATMKDLKVAGDITINTNGVRLKDLWQRTGDTITDLGTDNVVRDVIVQ